MHLDSYPLRVRILYWTCAILTVIVGLPSWLFYQSLSGRLIDQVQQESLRQFRFIQELYEQGEGFESLDALQQWVKTIGSSLGSRLTVLDESFRVIADSEIPRDEIPFVGSFANRPEVLQLQHKEIGILLRSSQLSRREYVCVAKRVKPKGSASGEYLRLAVPGSHIRDFLGHVREAFLILVLGSVLGAGATGYFVVRRGVRAQNQLLAQSIRNIASGHFERRVPTHPDHELHPLLSAINDMADRIQKRVRSISDQKQQWEAIFNGMEEGVLILDSRGRIQQHNLALSKLSRRAEESVGKRPLEIIMSNELQSICDQVLRPINPDNEGHPKRLSITMGDDRTYDVTVVRSEFLDGRMGAIIVFHDVTELRRLERVRQDFVANVSHELRTPLTSVKGYVETLLEDENLDKSTRASFLQVIKNNTDHMVKMVDDLLQLARLQARGSTSQRIPMDASEAFATAWKTCEPLAAEKKLRLRAHLKEEGTFIVAEPGRVVQIFRNLLENAIRYSPVNAEIIVTCTPHGKESLFSIQDDGPGIPWQHQQRVFERFYRVEKERSSRSGSTGLGLAICRHIILNHGGRIWVQSPNPDRSNGTTIFFTLERPSAEGSEPPSERVPHNPA